KELWRSSRIRWPGCAIPFVQTSSRTLPDVQSQDGVPAAEARPPAAPSQGGPQLPERMVPMRRIPRALAAVAALGLLAGCAAGYYTEGDATSLGFTTGVVNAPPPPQVHLQGTGPQYEYETVHHVEVMRIVEPQLDLFAYRGAYWLYADGYW